MSIVIPRSEEPLILSGKRLNCFAGATARAADSICVLTLHNVPRFPFRHLLRPKYGTKFRPTSVTDFPKHRRSKTF